MRPRKTLLLLLILNFMALASFAQEPSGTVAEKIEWYRSEVTRLENKLNTDISEKIRGMALEKLSIYKKRLEELEPESSFEPEYISAEAASEETAVPPPVEQKKMRFDGEVGGLAGMLEGGTAYLVESRLPLKYIIGPAKTSFRVSSGLVQNKAATRKYIPLGMDLILNYPPGVFTGLENYLGIGLNYVVLTTGRRTGDFGGQLFYGVQAEGFNGLIFGEIGYGILRTGFSPNHQGVIILVGYRSRLAF